MSGPARKKTGEPPAYWAEDDEADAVREASKPYLDQIKSKLPQLAETPAAMATIERILENYVRNREQPEAGADHRAVMKRREGMIAASHDLMERMAAVIEDGAPASLARAYDALAVAVVEVQQDPPEGYAESEARARDAALVALMDLAEAHGIEPEKMAFACGLIEYKKEDQFVRALNRAVKNFRGHN
jgi:thiamine monophosphate kinase